MSVRPLHFTRIPGEGLAYGEQAYLSDDRMFMFVYNDHLSGWRFMNAFGVEDERFDGTFDENGCSHGVFPTLKSAVAMLQMILDS